MMKLFIKNIFSGLKLFFIPPRKDQMDAIRSIKHFYGVDVLRGLSALVILIWHYHHFYYDQPMTASTSAPSIDRTAQPFYEVLFPFYEHGYWAVQLFWIVSGFVFAHIYAGRVTTAKAFSISRFARLYPLHLITLIFIAIMQLISVKLVGGSQIVPTNDGYHFFLNLLFISHWGFQDAISFNSPIWSVSVEIAIYILFFFIARYIYLLGVLFPVLIAGYGFYIVQVGTPFWFFAMCALFFFIGVAIYFFLLHFHKSKVVIYSVSVVSLLIFAKLLHKNQTVDIPFTNIEGFLFVPMVLIIGSLEFSEKFSSVAKKFKWVGNLTYSTYLWHFPIQVTILTMFSYLGFDRGIFNSGFTLIVWVIGMVIVGRLSYVYIERPLQFLVLKKFS